MTQQPVEEGAEEKEPARPEDVTLVRVRVTGSVQGGKTTLEKGLLHLLRG